jgi:pyruvate,water dikinase
MGPIRRALFDFVLERARTGCRARETMKSEAVRAFAVGRTFLLELGRRLTAAQALERAADVFFLEEQEVLRMGGGATPFDARGIVAARRAEFEHDRTLDPPPVVVGRYDPRRDVRAAVGAAAGAFAGLGVSGGRATGPARVILRPDTGETVRPGEVLVAPSTDPAWTPLFPNAAAIVMDLGGLLSHGSIIAREYGIPCVANVGDATRSIRTGQTLEVDGDRGTVRVLPGGPASSAGPSTH